MKPEEITRISFSTVGKGGYNASEVDTFLDKVSREVAAMNKNDEDLRRRMARMLETIREYDKEKEHIYKTLVAAQAMADTKVSEANSQAEDIMAQAGAQAQQLLGEKRAEADAYYFEKTHAADEKLATLQAQIAELEGKYSASLDEYIRLANEKAAEIIRKANDDAAQIVAAAFEDAKKARIQADETVATANVQLQTLCKKVSAYKTEVLASVQEILPAMQAIEVDVELAAPVTAVEVTSAEETKLPEFTFDFGKAKPAETPATLEAPVWKEDVSSFTTAQAVEAPTDAAPEVASAPEFFTPDVSKFLDELFDSEDSAPTKFIYDTGSFGADTNE